LDDPKPGVRQSRRRARRGRDRLLVRRDARGLHHGGHVLADDRSVLVDDLDSLRQPTNPAYNDEDNLHMALAMLLHNLYAIATPETWNGSPTADPCAVTGDGAPMAGDDAGAPPGSTDAGIDPGTSPSGCACNLSDRGLPATLPLFAFALLWILRRGRRVARR